MRPIAATVRRAAAATALGVALLATLSACGSGTAPGEIRIRVSGVLTSATTGHPLRFGGVTLYLLDLTAGTRTPLSSAVVNTNGSYVLTTSLDGCDESLLEIEGSALGYAPLVHDASSDPHVRCVVEAQPINFRLSPDRFP
ncbi:MAG: hypothetical protein IH616_05700 [Gemmatimonadales bacterium]|nr:hypothetical protein [Gemmatimonadales bacterium]